MTDVRYRMVLFRKAPDPKKPWPSPPFEGELIVLGARAIPRTGEFIKFNAHPHTYVVLEVSHMLPVPKDGRALVEELPVVGIELHMAWG